MVRKAEVPSPPPSTMVYPLELSAIAKSSIAIFARVAVAPEV